MLQSERDEQVVEDVKNWFKSGDDISIPIIQRKCKTGYNLAYRVYTKLVEDGIIIPPPKEHPHGVSKVN
jgi:DNA segregation ATPase FtsK/SpoIIIE-like protein